MYINYLIQFFSSTIRNAYTAWGAGMLGLGFCLLLMCFILCMHAYCVISDENDPENGSNSNAASNVQPMVGWFINPSCWCTYILYLFVTII